MIKNVFGGKLSRQLNYKHYAVARISRNIINIAKNIKADTVKVAISGIIPRRDTFNLKAKQVNKYLKRICKEEKTSLILHMVVPHVSICIAVVFIWMKKCYSFGPEL